MNEERVAQWPRGPRRAGQPPLGRPAPRRGHAGPPPTRRWLTTGLAALAAASIVAACGADPSTTSTTVSAPSTTHPTTSRPPVTTTTLEAPGWSLASRWGPTPLVDHRTFDLSDGAVVTVVRFRAGAVTFDLHAGSEDPPGVAAQVGAGAGPAISATEARFVVAAFNGGFKVASGSGGFVLDRRSFVALVPGDASFVIDTDGSAHVGVWGAGLPFKGEHIESVRQNLTELVADARPSPEVADIEAWGATLGGVPNPARSAVGEDTRGDILFAASMHALPRDLAVALLRSGAVRAMELDINPAWVQLALAPRPGAGLVAGVPGQEPPADQYLLGWTRDFFVVVARHPRG